MTCGQLFPLFCDDLGFSHVEAHFSSRIDDEILEVVLTLAQPKKDHFQWLLREIPYLSVLLLKPIIYILHQFGEEVIDL